MPYAAEISRSNPTCFLFLLDQSKSMLGAIGGGQGKTKADAVADSLNRLLYTLVLRCVWGQAVLDRFHVGVSLLEIVIDDHIVVFGPVAHLACGLRHAAMDRFVVILRARSQSPAARSIATVCR